MPAATEVKERPILFSAPMARAILAGYKTQTRRVVKPQPYRTPFGFAWDSPGLPIRGGGHMLVDNQSSQRWIHDCCPYGKPGDRLWVRETWQKSGIGWGNDLPVGKVHYRATDDGAWKPYWGGWKPSIHMPRWASRITLEITGVRVERLQDITQADAEAEGVESDSVELQDGGPEWSQMAVWADDFVGPYAELWDSINGPRGFGWDVNPWIWVVEFKRIKVSEMSRQEAS